MSEREALYRGICADPDDDAARLVFADWLQEHGEDDRAEFIRLQCRLARMTPADPEYVDLKIDERIAIECYGKKWLREPHETGGSVGALEGVSSMPRSGYERGFSSWGNLEAYSILLRDPERLKITARRRLGELRDATHLRRVELHTREGSSTTVLPTLGSPEWEPFVGLSLRSGGESGPEQAAAIARSEQFAGLRELHHTGGRVDDATLTVYSGETLPRLRRLAVAVTSVTPEGFARFVGANAGRPLESLELEDSSRDSGLVEAVATADWPCLHTLQLPNQIGTETSWPRSLAGARGLPKLASLALS